MGRFNQEKIMNQIINLIYVYSQIFNFSPELAIAVAEVESNFNQNKIGSYGEIGVFQIRPEFSNYTKIQLKNLNINVLEGIKKLKEAQDKCKHKQDLSFLVCYNAGFSGGSKIKYPSKFPYVKKVERKVKRNESFSQIDTSITQRRVFSNDFGRCYL